MDRAKRHRSGGIPDTFVGPTLPDFGSNQEAAEDLAPAEELDLGSSTITLESAAADLDASIESARPTDPFVHEAAWAGETAKRWRGFGFALSDARAHFDHKNSPTTPFGIQQEKAGIGGMKAAIRGVEAAAMDLEALRVGFDAGGAVLEIADETMQVSIGVLERRGYVDESESNNAILDESVEVGSRSAATEGFDDLPRLAEGLMAQQRSINAAWSSVRATAIEKASGADKKRKWEIEEAVAYIDQTLGMVVKVASFDAAGLVKPNVKRETGRIGSLVDLLVADELARLNANIDAALGHGKGVRGAGEKENLKAALETMAVLTEEFDAVLAGTRPNATDSLNEGDQVGTSMADALAAQTAAADVISRVQKRAEAAEHSMMAALGVSLHEPARSVLHGPDGGKRDLEHLAILTTSLDRRQSDHADQVTLIKEA